MQDTKKKKRTSHPAPKLPPRAETGGRQQRRDAYEAQQRGRARNGVKRKRKRRGNNTLLYIMVLMIMLTVGLVLIFTVFFKIVTIGVEGVTKYDGQQVVSSSGILEGVNMFRLDRASISAKLVKEYSYFESVKIKLDLPDGVIIQAAEAQPVGAIQQGDSYLLVSATGRVLEEGVSEPAPGIIRIKGFSALRIEEGDTIPGMLENMRKNAKAAAKYGENDTEAQRQEKREQLALVEELAKQIEEQYGMMNAFLSAMEAVDFSGIRSVDFGDKYNILADYGGTVSLEFGSESEIAYKVEFVKKLLGEDLESGFQGEIDVSYPGKARVRRMDLNALGMTADQYAEYLYEQNLGVTTEQESATEQNSELQSAQSSTASAEGSSSHQQAEPSDADASEDSDDETDYNSQGLPEIG